LGSLSDSVSTEAGVTYRTLTAGLVAGVAELTVANVSAITGDTLINIFSPTLRISADPAFVAAMGAARWS
jgi:hypothetical protein